jgi:hypothetical protein
MSIPIGILTPDGLQEAPYSADSLAAAVPFEPEGVYTITRTFNRDQVLMLDEHWIVWKNRRVWRTFRCAWIAPRCALPCGR